MPLKFRWPFSWPRRKRLATDKSSAQDSLSPASQDSAPVAAVLVAADLARAEQPAASGDASLVAAPPAAEQPEGPDLGLELLGRVPALATPPTLGRLAGLPAMAQTLPTIERFLRHLPAPPASPLLAGLSEATGFATSLPSLTGFTQPGSAGRPPAFPEQLEPPSEPTDVLAPPGGLPGQIAGLSGAAPVLAPERQPPVQPQVVPLPSRPEPTQPPAPGAPAFGAQVQRAAQAPAEPVRPAAPTPAPTTGAPMVAPLVTPGIQPTVTWPAAAAPLTQVLPLEQTLTGNILPAQALAPIQREVTSQAEEEWAAPRDFATPAEEPAQPAGERVTPEQRDAIETQRGQGRPLEPETRQRFEQAYGQPLGDVRVHTGPTAQATAESLSAIAFASGQDLFFTQNSYAPDSPQGLSLIGHELAHVIQQQYGVTGDADALRPPDDSYESQADQLAARALEAPLARAASPAEPASGPASVQREQPAEMRGPGSLPPLLAPAPRAPSEQLSRAANAGAMAQPLAGLLPPSSKLPEDEPVQRFIAANAASPDRPAITARPDRPPNMASAPQRLGRLTAQLLSPAARLSSRLSLSQDLPGLGPVLEAGQGLPVFRSLGRGLPGLGNLPDLSRGLRDLGQSNLPGDGALAGQLPGAPSLPSGLPSLGDSAPAMPDLGGLAQGLGGAGLPSMPGVPAGLPALGRLTPPAMPLAEGLGALGQAAGDAANGALAAGGQALGSITSMAPSGSEAAAVPPLPSLEKLTEHIWKEVQRKLKVERERSRGLA